MIKIICIILVSITANNSLMSVEDVEIQKTNIAFMLAMQRNAEVAGHCETIACIASNAGDVLFVSQWRGEGRERRPLFVSDTLTDSKAIMAFINTATFCSIRNDVLTFASPNYIKAARELGFGPFISLQLEKANCGFETSGFRWAVRLNTYGSGIAIMNDANLATSYKHEQFPYAMSREVGGTSFHVMLANNTESRNKALSKLFIDTIMMPNEISTQQGFDALFVRCKEIGLGNGFKEKSTVIPVP